MPALSPASRPKASFALIEKLASEAWSAWEAPGKLPSLPQVFVVIVRGYYDASMGKPGNDVGMYDDAAFIVSPSGFTGWNANADPSRHGWNPSVQKYMARLKLGTYIYKRLKHHPSKPTGYMAFGQGDAPVTVQRMKSDVTVHKEETGCFGINLHRGGINGTSSEGCITIPSDQWPAFDSTLTAALRMAECKTFPLILIQGPIT